MLKIHSGGSSSQQTVLTIPANQLKQLGVGTGSGGLQTILMPVGKGNVSLMTKKQWVLIPDIKTVLNITIMHSQVNKDSSI